MTRALALPQSRPRDPERGRGRAGLVERDPDRRRAEGVQRSPRPARDGPRRGGRDPVRRLGARRPGARRPGDGAPARGSPTGSCGSTRAPRAEDFAPRAGGMAAALPYCDALVSGHSLEALGARSSRRSRARRAATRSPGAGAEPPEAEERSRGRAPRPVPGSSVAMPSGYGPSRGRTTPGWSLAMSRRSCPRPASIPAATGRRCRPTRSAVPSRLLRPGGAQRADRPSGARAARARGANVTNQRRRGG